MRALLVFIAIIYLGGIALDLEPGLEAKWHNSTIIDLVAMSLRDLPRAAGWPVRIVQTWRGSSRRSAQTS